MSDSIRDYTKLFEEQAPATRERSLSTVFTWVYGWMFAGLAVSGATAWYTAASGLYRRVFSGPGFILCIIGELALVIGLSAGIRKLSAAAAGVLFLAYSLLNGLTLSVVLLAYRIGTVQLAFFLAAGMFGGLALFGSITRKDLSQVGAVCGMGLWGIILVMVVNLFLRSPRVDWALSLVGVAVFIGLTLYDARKIRLLAEESGPADPSALRKIGILGALTLYLDFVNLFLNLLRLLGGRRR